MTNRTLTTKLLGTVPYSDEKGTMMDAVILLDGKEVTIDFNISRNLLQKIILKISLL